MIDWGALVTNFYRFGWQIVTAVSVAIGARIIYVRWERRKIELEHRLLIMRQMTTSFHSLIDEHYTPLGQAVFNLKRSLSEGEGAEVSFYRLVRFLRLFELLPRVQLNDSLSECTFHTVGTEVRKSLLKVTKFSTEDLIKLKQEYTTMEFWQFRRRIHETSWLRDALDKYQTSICQETNEERIKQLQDLLACLADFISLEITRGKEPWYTRKDLYDWTKQKEDALEQLSNLDEKTKKEVSDYYQHILRMYEGRTTAVKRKLSAYCLKLRTLKILKKLPKRSKK